MKLLIKLSLIFLLIFSIFSGCYLCTYENTFSNLLYRITFYTENVKSHISDILLQKQNINNLTIKTDTSNLMNEYFITFFNYDNLNNINTKNKIEKICESSNFSILNCTSCDSDKNIENNYSNFLNKDNFLIVENTPQEHLPNYKTINENLYRFYQYNNFSISYSNPKLLTNKDLLKLYKYINTLEHSFYIPIIMFNNNHLDRNLLKNISNNNAIFIILGDTFSISPSKNIPILQVNSKETNSFFQINLFISNSNLNKIRLKIFPLDENGITPPIDYLKNMLKEYNTNSENQFYLGENQEYIYVDY